jgi:hypothetical protein
MRTKQGGATCLQSGSSVIHTVSRVEPRTGRALYWTMLPYVARITINIAAHEFCKPVVFCRLFNPLKPSDYYVYHRL